MKPGSNIIYNTVCANIWGYMRRNKVEGGEMAACTGRIAKSTFYERLRQPEDFRLSELIAISKKMGISVHELLGEESQRTDALKVC